MTTPAAPPEPRPLLLIVDDEPDILREMVDWMDLADFSGLTASSGAEAMECLETHPSIRVVITDIRMPGVDGHELLRWARGHQFEGREFSFIVLTGHLPASDQDDLLESGAVGWLAKPVDLEELESMVRRCLR